MSRTALLTIACLGAAMAQLDPSILGLDRLPNGNTVIATNRFNTCDSALALEVDSFGHLVWGYLGGGLDNVHTARRLANGNTLVTPTGTRRVIEVDRVGNEVWSFREGLAYPNEAYRLGNGNTLITDRNNDRVIEVSPAGSIVWSYVNLMGPHNGQRLANGNTLICDSEDDRVLEVNPQGEVVWQLTDGLDWPRFAHRMVNGNTLITDSRHDRVVEVDPSGREVWMSSNGIGSPYMAERLANGRTLVSMPDRAVEIDSSGAICWEWPSTLSLMIEDMWVRNPATGLQLFVQLHRPAPISASPVPVVVLVPDGIHTSEYFDSTGLAQLLAENGFAAMCFDADGRGRSDPFPENYYGSVNQQGLLACIDALAEMPDIDTSRIGILTEGYGITLATGMLANTSNPGAAKFLLDFEGPADRYQSFIDSGGAVPVSPDDESFWQEREAVRFMSSVPCPYLRIQTGQDRNPHITDNRHCIALIDSATTGGLLDHGISPWTRVNDSVMNEPNRFYSLENPPVWIPESQEAFTPVRYVFYLRELLGLLEQTPVDDQASSGSPAGRLAARPNPFRTRTMLEFDDPGRSAVEIVDAAGRLVRTLPAAARQAWDGRDAAGSVVPVGVYYCRLEGGGTAVSGKLVKTQ